MVAAWGSALEGQLPGSGPGVGQEVALLTEAQGLGAHGRPRPSVCPAARAVTARPELAAAAERAAVCWSRQEPNT